MILRAPALALFLAALTASCSPPPASDDLTPGHAADIATFLDDYIDRYLSTFPSRATAAGRYDGEDRLEDLGPAEVAAWVTFNRDTAARAEGLLDAATDPDDRLDLELLVRQARRTVLELATHDRPRHDPLFWTGALGNATVFQLVRADRPLEKRLAHAAARAAHLPRLAAQATEALSAGDPARHAPELFAIAARQARATATFYRDGFAHAADAVAAPERETLEAALATAGTAAAEALDALVETLGTLGAEATGSPRLGARYGERFRLVTGIEESVDAVLRRALVALDAKRREAAGYGRSIWNRVFGNRPLPDADADVLGALFARIAEDRADSVETFVADYDQLLADAVAFVRDHEVVTLPEPLTVFVSRSPDFFVGQGVGGVYPAGPFAPDADTLFYLPTPPSDAPPAARDALFRDFNHHFNVMITPHEMVPGHYLQAKIAARHPRRIRALFGDGVFIEGWGTFCERLMLDLGWGEPLDRMAHLKKQLENIARTIVDIRVHTEGLTQDEVLAFVRDEALQDEHFARNMWTRAITSSPQLTSYFLGYEQVWGLYEAVRADRGDAFVLRDFTDGVMAIGPVPVVRMRERLVGANRP